MTRNVFVLGLTEFQRQELETIRGAEQYTFHDLIGYEPLVKRNHVNFEALLNQGREELRTFDGSVDAIICHWDFPSSVLAPILAADYGIPAPSLESVLASEHKYWSRLMQAESVPENTPAFASFEPFDDDAAVLDDIGMDFPFWIKPVKSFSSQLGFRIDDADQLSHALDKIREGVHDIGDAFDEALAMIDVPPEIAEVSGTGCLAEEIITGVQLAPEGSVFQGTFGVHGMFDMPKDERWESFLSFRYPASAAPDDVLDRMAKASERYLQHIGFDNGCFNVEFLWDERTDDLKIIEVNSRISQSHAELFRMVDGVSNHEIAVDIALGREPTLPAGKGEFDAAAKCMILHPDDGVVCRVPTQAEVDELAEMVPGAKVELGVVPGDRLADLAHQDSYNYRLGHFFVGASDAEELERRRLECLEALHFEFDPPPAENDPAEDSTDTR